MLKRDIEDALKEKNLSKNTIDSYTRNLEKLNKNEPLNNWKFLENPEIIKTKLEKYKPNTTRNYLISIVSSLNALKGQNKKLNKLADNYYNLMITKSKEIEEKPKDEMTETQKKNWLKWDEILNKFNIIEQKVNNFIDNKTISQTQYNILLNYMILALYVHAKPRRNLDYQVMNIIKKYTTNLDDNKNYLSYDDDKFIFNIFKTMKSKGQQEKDINEDLKEVIKKYIKFHPNLKGKITKNTNTKFLVNYDGSALDNVNAITRILNKIFGLHIGSSMLRHIYLSNKYGDTLQEMKEDADDMAHSVNQQKEYIKKENKLDLDDKLEPTKTKKKQKSKILVEFS